MIDTTLSRGHWREAICQWLQRRDPLHARWLQEHPRRQEILNELTTDAIDLWLHAVNERANNPLSFWAVCPQEDQESTVLSRTLEAPELWPDLDEDYPRTPPPPARDPMMLSTIPASGRTGRRSPPTT